MHSVPISTARTTKSNCRNVYDDRDILLDSTVSKDFVWNRGYELNWDLTRSLKFDLTINNQSRIDELPGAYDYVPEREQQSLVANRCGTALRTAAARSITTTA